MSARTPESPGASLLARWNTLRRWPGGGIVFSALLRRSVPYTGSIRPRILELAPGRCRVQMHDRRAVRNHLRSIHAVALTNLGEVTGGLAMVTALPPHVRGIVVAIETRFVKKARGTLEAEAVCEPPDVDEPMEFDVHAQIRDPDGDVVAVTTSRWRLAPR